MKKQIALSIVVLAIMILSAGCAQGNESALPVQETVGSADSISNDVSETLNTEENIETDPPITVPEPTGELVSDAYCEIYEYEDTEFNSVTQKREKVTKTIEYHIPKVNLPGENIKTVNEELYSTLKNTVDESVQCANEYGYHMGYGISYRWSVNEDIVSIVVLNNLTPEYGGDEYMVYNVSVSTGEIVSKEDVIRAGGMTQSEYNEKANADIKKEFKRYSGFDNITDAQFRNFAQEQLQKTLKQDNIDLAKPYLNENGDLCIVYRYYAVAGGEYYWETLNLRDGSTGTNFFEEDVTEPTEPSPVQSAMEGYKKVLSQCTDEKAEYTLYDIDKDGTPELILKERYSKYYIYSYIDNKAVLCGEHHWTYSNCLYEYEGNGIVVYDGGMGSMHSEYLVVVTLKNGDTQHGEFLASSDDGNIEKALKEYKSISSFISIKDLSLF